MIISRSIEIHGVQQWIYISKGRREGPALLFLHGGPGWVDAPWAHRYCRRFWGEITTIHWDQRGSNRSDTLSPNQMDSTLTVEQMVQDTLQLAEILKTEYDLDQLLIVGHSWGALLGALCAKAAPELFVGFVGIGQLVSNRESEPLSLDYCVQRAHLIKDPVRRKRLEGLSQGFYENLDDLWFQREILFSLGGEFYRAVSEDDLRCWTTEGSPEYRSDMSLLYKGCEQVCKALWNRVIQYDLFRLIERLEIPVYLFVGRHDRVTSSQVAERWFSQLDAPAGKELIWFENSAHWPHLEENEKFHACIEQILVSSVIAV